MNIESPCDHEWEFVDDSFDNEYGTEQVHYFRCSKCDATKDMEPGDYHFDYDDYLAGFDTGEDFGCVHWETEVFTGNI